MNRKGIVRGAKIWMWLTFAFVYTPIVTVIFMSFNGTSFGMLPFTFTTKWYTTLFTTSDLPPATFLSLGFAAVVAASALILGTMTSVGIQYLPRKWADKLNSAIQLPIIIPWLVTSISILLLFTFIGIGRSYLTMYLGNLIVVLPYVVMLVNGRFVEMDRNPEAAATLLGAGPFRVFLDITLPAILPGVLAGGIMAFIICFNNFVLQYYLAPVGVNTLPVLVFTRIKASYQADLNALSTIIVLLSVCVVVLLSKMGYSATSLFGYSSPKKKKGD